MTCKHPTIHHDRLISLIDGKPYVMLKRHLQKHGYTPDSYRAAFDLPADYPMVTEEYSKRRAVLSSQIDHSNRWDPNTNMHLSERRASAPYKAQPRAKRKT